MKIKTHKTAGGVVLNAENRVLVLERDVERGGGLVHEIRLPKGHIDPGESDEAAACREVGEESGYWHTAIIADLGVAHSSFVYRGRQHERDEHYFLMRLESPERGAPAPAGSEEALFQPVWLALDEAAERMTYPSEKDFILRAVYSSGPGKPA
jgi:8-oxo-dGTP pyrophosphatase MutT (NUDIX family)